MDSFESVFPQFLVACARLYNAFMPWALAILVLSFAFEFWHGATDLQSLFRFLAKLFLIVLLTAQARELINSGQLVIDQFVEKTGLTRPENLAQDYKHRLAEAFGDPSIKDKSAIRLLLSGKLLDALLYAVLLVFSYITLGVVTFITYVQKMSLLVCWGCCPALFALSAIRPVAHLGTAHIMRILAILCWPLGFAVAATFSTGLLNKALHDRILAGGVAASLGAAIESMLIVAVVGVWAVVSTIAAPALIHLFLVGHLGAGGMASAAAAGGLRWFTSAAVQTAAWGTRLAKGVGDSIRAHRPASGREEAPPPPRPVPLALPPPPAAPAKPAAFPAGQTFPPPPNVPPPPAIPPPPEIPPPSAIPPAPAMPPPPAIPPAPAIPSAPRIPPPPQIPPPPIVPPPSPIPPPSVADPTGAKRLEELLQRH